VAKSKKRGGPFSSANFLQQGILLLEPNGEFAEGYNSEMQFLK
jgi:hypothetical protein